MDAHRHRPITRIVQLHPPAHDGQPGIGLERGVDTLEPVVR
jgi:hypothetical protein